MYLKKHLSLILLILLIFTVGCTQTPDKDVYQVTRVVDGDTIVVDIDGVSEKVRLIGVDTPETVHPTKGVEPYGKEASNFTKAQLEGKKVRLEFDVQERDKYGRLLAYIWLDNKLFNETLVEKGYAQIATFPPNVKYVERFKAAQQRAREANLGLWGVLPEQTSSSKESAQLTPKQETGTYVGSVNSKKYHKRDCKWAKEIHTENSIFFNTKAEAEKAGYVPCKYCKP